MRVRSPSFLALFRQLLWHGPTLGVLSCWTMPSSPLASSLPPSSCPSSFAWLFPVYGCVKCSPGLTSQTASEVTSFWAWIRRIACRAVDWKSLKLRRRVPPPQKMDLHTPTPKQASTFPNPFLLSLPLSLFLHHHRGCKRTRIENMASTTTTFNVGMTCEGK